MARGSRQARRVVSGLTLDTEDFVKLAAHAAADKKASERVMLDLRKVASFTEYFLLLTGTSSRQVQAIADAIEENLRENGKRPLHIEGKTGAEWVLMDYGDFIVHVFTGPSRKFYDLERLWRDAGRVELGDGEG
ncbi:MAG TPA: ribosome silencing factor [Blastocatellia bacterium]|nr:ribosome silencing factor [Blastocatellia bacterium]